MKKISRSVGALLSLGATALLALLGQNCQGVGSMEYGTPHATFVVKSKVKNVRNEPIKGIEVSVQHHEQQVNVGITDEKGEANIRFEDFPTNKDIHVIARDIDGAANGAYNDAQATIDGKTLHYQGGSGWNEGTAISSVELEMQEKTE